MIDPDIKGLLSAMEEGGFELPDPLDAMSLRNMFDTPIPAPTVEIAVRRDISIQTDGVTIAARLYHPMPGEVLPVVLFFHGGGWVHGTLDTHDRLAATLGIQAQAAVVSVDYRLAPEYAFPAAWEDALKSLRWIKHHHNELGIDPNRIAIAGDSSGGNIAAALAQAVAGDKSIVHQLLFYPALDGQCSSPSFAENHPGFLSPEQMRWYWRQYAPGALISDPRASPAAAPISRELAPATIIVAGNDPLHDEGVAYAKALEDTGVSIKIHIYPGAIHGFASFIGIVPMSDDAVAAATENLRTAFFHRDKQLSSIK